MGAGAMAWSGTSTAASTDYEATLRLEKLSRVRKFDVPTREDKNSGVTLQGAREHLRTFDAEPDPIVFDCRYRGLRDARQT
jgi:hypothetical protein